MACQADAKAFVRKRIGGPLARALLVGALVLATTAGAAAQPSWPSATIPDGVHTFAIGGELTNNGVPMRLQGFTSVKSPAEVVEMFRQSLGKPLVEDSVKSKVVLGRALGKHYVTIQLQPSGAGTRGVIAVAGLAAAIGNRHVSRSDDERLLSRLPPGSRVISRTGSVDGKAAAEHVVLSNSHSPALNIEYVKSMLGDDGFKYERESSSGGDKSKAQSSNSRDGRTIFFRGPTGEAMAVIFRADSGGTTVVLNTIRHPELLK